LAVYVFYYYNNNPEKGNNRIDPTDKYSRTNSLSHSGIDSIHKDNAEGPRSPPKLTNLYNQELEVIHSKNDIDIINKSNMLLYKDEYQSSNPTFESELINTNMSGKFTSDLEKVYTHDLAENKDTTHDYNEIFDYCVKPNKSDLPIANIPLYALKDFSCSLKLSDSFNDKNRQYV
jgi:hypothetical protein